MNKRDQINKETDGIIERKDVKMKLSSKRDENKNKKPSLLLKYQITKIDIILSVLIILVIMITTFSALYFGSYYIFHLLLN
jgi:hypothetical protein